MSQRCWLWFRGFLKDDRGQILPMVAVMLVAMIAMMGFTIDFGRLLYTYRQLQAATDAAALAGGYELPLSDAASVATHYSAVSGNLNARLTLPGVTMVGGYPKILCLNTLTTQGMACASPANGNAIQVKQQITLPLYFMSLVGQSSVTITAVATSSMTGSTRAPYNVAIILDSTPSMKTTDSDSNCNSTRIACALTGVQTLLLNLSPCAANLSTCGTATSGNYAYPVDEVALYTFPGLTSAAQATYDYDCSGSTNPTSSPYTESSSFPVYQIVGFSSDYRTSNSSTSLNASSSIVKAIGGASGCPGMTASTGSYRTYFAGIIYKTAYDLYYQQQSRPGSQNAIILLGDGDANALASSMPNASTTSGTYPSSKNECQQAITLAQEAFGLYAMRIYSIAYGAASSGCSTDSGALTPCATMSGMASAPQDFYSDATATGSGNCISTYHPTLSLNSIFTQISGDLSTARLIPDNTT